MKDPDATVFGLNRRTALLVIFVLSGFTSLIYESIWSHYLKLFLGHAAYAQTLVLAIFMGGMALGSWVVARRSGRLRKLMAGYMLVEGLIGLCGLVFHLVFVGVTDWALESVIPALPSATTVHLFKWTLATALILPQSILLGMTFPLLSNGIIRRWPQRPGEVLSMLYFTNSLGAAIGVLVGGFLLIGLVGLPGTLLTAGLLNLALALAGWLIIRDQDEPAPHAPERSAADPATGGLARWFVWAAFLTGAASFFYEIGWIRMLSLVLGSSTHSFELMLSAFIFGLACGGFWMRRRIDRIANPMRYLGAVMLTMGLLALLTLPAYDTTFDFIAWALGALSRTESGYAAFTLASHAVSVLIMLPATFCAGMTLPLMTAAVLRSSGERAIGTVYAANTLGAIVGVLLAVHVAMPVFGVKGVIVSGATLHLLLGVVATAILATHRPLVRGLVAAGAAALVLFASFGLRLDPLRMTSAVYRTGVASQPADTKVNYLRHGKTATISVLEREGTRVIATNGKPDAAIRMSEGPPHPDEVTMMVAAALPLSLHSNPRRVANIGFGSGLTSTALLADARVKHLDSIEIEPFMVEGATQAFGPRIRRALEDSRSRIVYEDAKTFFAASREPYDLIVSEPSNPWVSGVATLFSEEFYRRIRGYLRPDGYFVQWIQVYETDLSIFASVLKALSRQFPNYEMYLTDDSDVLIVATSAKEFPVANSQPFDSPEFRRELARIGVMSTADLMQRRLGDRRTLGPLFENFEVPANSDYFPFVDLNAARLRYMQRTAIELPSLLTLPIPVTELLAARSARAPPGLPSGRGMMERDERLRSARAFRDAFLAGDLERLPPSMAREIQLIETSAEQCRQAGARAVWRSAAREISNRTTPYLSPTESEPLWEKIRKTPCYQDVEGSHRLWTDMLSAMARRDARALSTLGHDLLQKSSAEMNREEVTFLVTSIAAADVARGEPGNALRLLNAMWPHLDHESAYALSLQILRTHSALAAAPRST